MEWNIQQIKTRLIVTGGYCVSEQKSIAMHHKYGSRRDNDLYGTIPVAILRTIHPQFLAFAILQRISYVEFSCHRLFHALLFHTSHGKPRTV
jgi:hypothetical protein